MSAPAVVRRVFSDIPAGEAETIKTAAMEMVAAGTPWKVAARHFNVVPTTLHLHCDPKYREATRKRRRELRKPTGRIHGFDPVHNRVPREDVAARLAEIPTDTRTLTQRAFGDPLPGRRACDRRNA